MTGLLTQNRPTIARYTFFWLKWFLNDGASLIPTRDTIEVYLFLAEMVSE